MKLWNLPKYSVGMAFVALFLAGCGNTASHFVSSSGATLQSATGSTMNPFIVQRTQDADVIYGPCARRWQVSVPKWQDQLGPCYYPDSPLSVAYGSANADAKTLYAGLSNDTIAISQWGKGQYKQVGTLTGLTGSPTAIATDSEGNVWATTSPSTTISEFYAGVTTPSASYTDSNLTSLSYVAVDKSNNVYVEGQAAASGGIEVDELPYGGKTFTAINAPGQLGYTAGGLAISCPHKPCPIAGNGNVEYLFVNDQGASSSPATITKWERKRGKLGKVASFQYSGIDTAISVDPFTKDPNDVFAANNVPSGSAFVASGVEYAFPGGNVVSSSPTTSGTFEALDIAISKKP